MKPKNELPICPTDFVLFPQMLMPIKLPEAIYQKMVSRCIEFDEPFGVIYTGEDDGKEKKVSADMVGTLAVIRSMQSLGDGILELYVEGEERFRIQEMDSRTKPYLVGDLEFLNDSRLPKTIKARRLVRHAQDTLRVYLELVLSSDSADIDIALPSDHIMLPYAMAMAAEVSQSSRQKLLEISDPLHRLEIALPWLENRVVIMKQGHTSALDIEKYREWLALVN